MKPFFDTNILVYAQQSGARGARARELVAEGGVVNVQVLNELVNVLRKKLKLRKHRVLRKLQRFADISSEILGYGVLRELRLQARRDHKAKPIIERNQASVKGRVMQA